MPNKVLDRLVKVGKEHGIDTVNARAMDVSNLSFQLHSTTTPGGSFKHASFQDAMSQRFKHDLVHHQMNMMSTVRLGFVIRGVVAGAHSEQQEGPGDAE